LAGFGFGKMPRRASVPVDGLTWLLMKSSLPRYGKSSSPSVAMKTGRLTFWSGDAPPRQLNPPAAQEQGVVGKTPGPALAVRRQTLADKLVRNGNPDRYAAAFCIRVRSERLLLGYSGDESWRLSMLRKT